MSSSSLLTICFAALLVFGIWYPYPYREISGGRELFLLVITVDVILGPLITLAVFNRKKPRSELRRDLAIVALLQLGALGYGSAAANQCGSRQRKGAREKRQRRLHGNIPFTNKNQSHLYSTLEP